MTTTRTEFLEISGFSLATFGWEVVDLAPIWPEANSANKRGSDRKVPGVNGVRPYPRRPDVSVRSLPMVVYGDVDEDGVAYADARVGIRNNLRAIKVAIVDAPAALDGLRPAVLHYADGETASGDVHVVGFASAILSPSAVRAVLSLSIPDGELVPDP